MSNSINIKNKKAWHDYEILEKFVAGIELYGTEIKSIREGKASLTDSYCVVMPKPGKPDVTEIWVKMYIAEYTHGTYNNHEARRERRLLLHRREINKIAKKVTATGLAIIPLQIFLTEKGLAKIEISVAQGKKKYDKRESLKAKDDVREMSRMKKNKYE